MIAATVFICLKIDEIKKERSAKQKLKEVKETENRKIETIIEKDQTRKEEKVGYDKNTRVFYSGDDNNLEKTGREKIKQNYNNLLKMASEAKRKEEVEYEEAQKKLKKILEKDSPLSGFIKRLWRNRAFYGRRYLSDSGKMYYGIHSLEFQKGKKRIILGINSRRGDYSTIGRVLISASWSEKKGLSYRGIEELTDKEFKETGKLLEEINAD